MKSFTVIIAAGIAVTAAAYMPPPGGDNYVPADNFSLFGHTVTQNRHDVRRDSDLFSFNDEPITLMCLAMPVGSAVDQLFEPVMLGDYRDELKSVWIKSVWHHPAGGEIVAWMPVYKDRNRGVELYVVSYDRNGCPVDIVFGGTTREGESLYTDALTLPEDVDLSMSYHMRATLTDKRLSFGGSVFAGLRPSGTRQQRNYVLNGEIRYNYDIDDEGRFVNYHVTDTMTSGTFDADTRRVLEAVHRPLRDRNWMQSWVEAGKDLREDTPAYNIYRDYTVRLYESDPDECCAWIVSHDDRTLLGWLEKLAFSGVIDKDEFRDTFAKQMADPRNRILPDIRP